MLFIVERQKRGDSFWALDTRKQNEYYGASLHTQHPPEKVHIRKHTGTFHSNCLPRYKCTPPRILIVTSTMHIL